MQVPIRLYNVKSPPPSPSTLRWMAAATLVAVCTVAAPMPAEGGRPDVPSRVGVSRGASSRTSVLGVAWTVDNAPIAGARVQLRNLVSGKLESKAVANTAGQFTFSGFEGGTYLVELTNENERILTVGHPFTIAQGETVATFVRLGARVPWSSTFFGNAARAVATAAASQGITAIAPVQLPKSR